LDHSAHRPLASGELTEANLVDAVIYGPDDEKVGTVSHVHGMGQTSEVIVDVGGFLGIGAKPVALATTRLKFMRDESGSIHATTSMTRDEAKALPEHHH
jgi:PRC-barrel domain